MIDVLLIDVHRVVLVALKTMLEQEDDIRVVGAISDPHQAVTSARELSPDVILLDLRWRISTESR